MSETDFRATITEARVLIKLERLNIITPNERRMFVNLLREKHGLPPLTHPDDAHPPQEEPE